MRVSSHLHNSADRPTTLSELAERMGVSRREAEMLVQAARLEGVPVVSNNCGLWLGTDQEALEWCQRAHDRAIHQLETIKGVRAGVERRAAPLTLWEAA
jgi:hypothetical protein